MFPDDAVDPETLVRFADVAMYTAKRKRCRTELYDPAEDDSSREALALGGEIRQALEDGSIVAHYQPKVEVESGRILGAEALARWDHPTRGLVPPGAFLPVVEKAGLMRLLTKRVLGLAIEQAAAWQRDGTPIEVAVNIDIRALLDPTFPATVEAILADAGLPAGQLTLEITETSLMADPTRSRGVAEELAAIGVRLSIDDFGTGYSSLGHLTALPLSEHPVRTRVPSAVRARAVRACGMRATLQLLTMILMSSMPDAPGSGAGGQRNASASGSQRSSGAG